MSEEKPKLKIATKFAAKAAATSTEPTTPRISISEPRNVLVRTTVKDEKQIRLLLVGPPGYGKTTAACTFPNPIIVDFDNNQPPEIRSRALLTLPVWDAEFRSKNPVGIISGGVAEKYPYRWFHHWLMSPESRSLDVDSTLILDSMSVLNDLILIQINDMEAKEIEKNPFHRWAVFADTWVALCHLFTTLKCNVVLVAHENELRDNETNRLLQRIWLMDGKKFTPRLGSFFNNVFRQTRTTDKSKSLVSKDKADEVDPKAVVHEEYWWQIRDDNGLFPFARTTIKSPLKYVPPTYESFQL